MLAFAAPVSPPVSEMEIVVEVSLTKSGVPEHSVKVRLGWEKRMIVDRLQTFWKWVKDYVCQERMISMSSLHFILGINLTIWVQLLVSYANGIL